MNKKYQIGISRVPRLLFAVCLILLLSASRTLATASSFSAMGEYVAGDFETPSVAEQRAFMDAKENVAEQMSIYVVKRIQAANGKISKERGYAIAWNLLQESHRGTHSEALPGGDKRIIVELIATLDDSAIDTAFQRPHKEQRQATLMVDELCRTVERICCEC